MAEKRGHTGKLKYDFNQANNLEIQMGETWYRVTPRDFRSFNAPRRITEIEYNGPIYLWDTNTIVKEPKLIGVQHIDDVDPRKKLNKRENERSQENN
jgi:hypothetical protein